MSDTVDLVENMDGSPLDDTSLNAEQDVSALALAYLSKILELANVDAVASIAAVSAGEVTLDISGVDASLFIGRHGQTLDSLQYLLLVMISSRKSPAHAFRIMVDVEGYRLRRTETLTRYAKSIAAQVRETNQEAELEPLNSLERRIVHTALLDDPYVETYSEGYGNDRHVVISPRKSRSDGSARP